MIVENNTRGSEWNKWDLQVQTILDDGYIELSKYYQELKNNDSNKWTQFVDKVGGENNALLFDSKQHYTDGNKSKQDRCQDYVRTFFAYLEVYNPDLKVIGITDHNYSDTELIDYFMDFSKKTFCKVLPGVEINSGGVHKLIFFEKPPCDQTTFSEGIKIFLSKIGINNPQENGVLKLSDKSLADIVTEIENCNAISIYPHCNSSNGLFQERGKTDRTHLSDIFNKLQSPIILQARNKDAMDKVSIYIKNNPAMFTNEFVSTIAPDSRSLRNIGCPDSNGNYLWIKAEPTFEGFRQIKFETDRVFIGLEPPIIRAYNSKPTKFINKLIVNSIPEYDGSKGLWFQNTVIDFNRELVSIIGNKGSGKSAIADILGLLGDSRRFNNFSFLTTDKFKRKQLAKNFSAELVWQSGDSVTRNLQAETQTDQPETIKYLPQSYFDKLCNDLDDKVFSKELNQVVFSHLSPEARLEKITFEDLVEYKTKNINYEIKAFQEELGKVNTKLCDLEKQLHPQHIAEVTNLKSQKETELKAHIKTKPKEIKVPSNDNQAYKQKIEKLEMLRKEIDSLNKEIDSTTKKIVTLSKDLEDLTNFKSSMRIKENELESFKNSYSHIIEKYNISWDKLLTVKVHYKTIDALIASKTNELTSLKNKTITSELIVKIQDEKLQIKAQKASLKYKVELKEESLHKLTNELRGPEKKYQEYQGAIKIWEEEKKKIEGDKDQVGTIAFYDNQLKYIKNELKELVDDFRRQRLEKSVEIFNKKSEILNVYNSIKTSVDGVIEVNQSLLQEYRIKLNVGFIINKQEFISNFLTHINQRNKGTFKGVDDGEKFLKELIDNVNFNEIESISLFLNKIIEYLELDQKKEIKEEERKKYIVDQVKDPVEFYNMLFSLDYITINYQLQLDSKNIDTLSPGEKGALLLVFYLMLDKNDIPLVIDQPEDNLDNKSVSKILVPFIKQAKQRRQIIMVTHNPNLAVVADAEQIISVNIDKTNNLSFSYISGGIENPEINKMIVDILEGTFPAFDKRRLKYNR